jgi:hypothetical protein
MVHGFPNIFSTKGVCEGYLFGKHHRAMFEQAMNAKYEFLIKKKTWNRVPLPSGNNIIGCKWVYKTKFTT